MTSMDDVQRKLVTTEKKSTKSLVGSWHWQIQRWKMYVR
jgi:hypothetical protein